MTRDLPTPRPPDRGRRPGGARPAALAAIVLLSAFVRVTCPVAEAQEPGIRKEDGLVYFNLQNVDIRSALESISEVLGISYVLGGSVPTGTPITINTAAGIPIEKVPDLLDSVLRTYNLTLIRTGDVFTVIQAGEAQQGMTPEAAHTQVYVYYLRNANAVDLANVLNALFSGSTPPGGFQRRSTAGQALSERLEGQTLPYASQTRAPYAGQGGEDETQNQQPPAQPPGVVTRIIPGELVGQTSIVPDETTNSLIIKTAPENYASLEETIRKLDVRPLQVLIEVTIAEITLDKSSQFGIEYLLRDKTRISGETVKGELEVTNTTPFTGGLRAHVFDAGNVDVTLRALAADSRVNILSTPRVLAVNNHEARILIGSEVPFVQFSRATTGEAIDQVVQYRNVGLELTVTPRINPDRYITMDLLQQVSSLSNDVLFDAPIITTREAQTSLVVSDNQTIVLGGLMEDRKEKRKNGIPILKDIPVLGYLFGSRSERTVKTELVLTLTPYIVGSDSEIENLRKEVEDHSELYHKELEHRREEGHFVPGDLAPERATPPGGPPTGQGPEGAPPTAEEPGAVPPAAEPQPAPAPPPAAPEPAPAMPPPPPPPAPSDTTAATPGPTSRAAPAADGRLARIAPAGEEPAGGELKVQVEGATVLPSASPPFGKPQPASERTVSQGEAAAAPRLAGAPQPADRAGPPAKGPVGAEDGEHRMDNLQRALVGSTYGPLPEDGTRPAESEPRRDDGPLPSYASPAAERARGEEPAPAAERARGEEPAPAAQTTPPVAVAAVRPGREEKAPANRVAAGEPGAEEKKPMAPETATRKSADVPRHQGGAGARTPSEPSVAPAGAREVGATQDAIAKTTPPEIEPAPPETEPAPPETEPAPPETEPTPPETEPAPPETEPFPPETQPNPAVADFRQPRVEPMPSGRGFTAPEEQSTPLIADFRQPRVEPMPSGRGFTAPEEQSTPLIADFRQPRVEPAPSGRGFTAPEEKPALPAAEFTPPEERPTPPAEEFTPPEQQPALPAAEFTPPEQQPALPAEEFTPPEQQPAPPAAEFTPPEQQPALPAEEFTPPEQQPTPPAAEFTPPEPGPALPGEITGAETAEQGYRIQILADPDLEHARRAASQARERLGPDMPVYVEFMNPFYKVRVGDFSTRTEAVSAMSRLRSLGYPDAWPVQTPIHPGS